MSNLSLLDLCRKCGSRCCKEPGPPVVFPEEAERIGEFVKERGLENHIEPVEGEELYFIPRRGKPCPYLDGDGRCAIQDVKPLDCRVYPLGLTRSLRVGVSASCPAKHLLTQQYEAEAGELLQTLSDSRKEGLFRMGEKGGYVYTQRPSPYGQELLLDLYGCERAMLESRAHLERYNAEIVRLIGMKAVGPPIIPEKFGEGTLHGYSSVQFIQTSSIVVHLSEDLLEAHVDIFSCKPFNEKIAEKFTAGFFNAERVRSQLLER